MAAIDIKPPVDRYKAIADAIREKNGTTELMHPADMPQAILDIVSGGGTNYESIVYNEDNTITLTDKDGVVHTMECEYTDGKLTSVKYDGKAVELTYDGDVLVEVGKTAVDMANAQTSEIEILDHIVKFMVDGEPYEVVSVKDGNSVNEPLVEPTKEGYNFNGWNDGNSNIVFPLTPTNDIDLTAIFDEKESYSNMLYEHFGVSETEYPYIVIEYSTSSKQLRLMFSKTIGQNSERFLVSTPYLYTYKSSVTISEITTENVVDKCITALPAELGTEVSTGRACYGGENLYYWVNKTLNYPYENHNLYYFN